MKKSIKKTICATLIAITALSTASTVLADDVKVNVDGQQIEFDVQPQIMDGRTMVPVRAIFEAVGATVEWDDKTKTVTGTKGDTVVKMTVGSDRVIVNDVPLYMDCVPIEIDHRVLTPARYVVESFGYIVTWDDIGNTVEIMTMDAYKDYIANGGKVSNMDGDPSTTTEKTEEKGVWGKIGDWFKGLFGK